MPVSVEKAAQLGLAPMTMDATDPHGTAFTTSIDLDNGSTGISAYDRAATIAHAVSTNAKASDFIRPGHMFPLIARAGGLKERRGHTEAAIELASLCGSGPVAVICEIIDEDGQMARGASLAAFAKTHNLRMTTIEDLVSYLANESLESSSSVSDFWSNYQFDQAVDMPTAYGHFKMQAFYETPREQPHLLLYTGFEPGALTDASPVPLVRVHSECMTGDVFGSKRCECGEQLEESLKAIQAHGTGVLIYLRQEGRGIGLVEKLKAYRLQEEGHDTVSANTKLGHLPDQRNYQAAVKALQYLGIKTMDLITGNPQKARDIQQAGITIQRHYPINVTITPENYHYLKIKETYFGHLVVSKN